MKKLLNLLCLLAISSFVASCATVGLNHEDLKNNKIETIKFNSDSLNYQVSDSTTTGAAAFGILGAVVAAGVDSGINAKRKKAIQPILSKLTDFKPEDLFKERLQIMSGQSFAKDISVLNVSQIPTDDQIQAKFLYIYNSYTLTPDHKSLVANASITYKSNNESKTYKSNFSSTEALNIPASMSKKEQVTNFLVSNINIIKESTSSLSTTLVKQIEQHFNIPKKD